VQAASDTNGPTERDDINVEIQQLKSEIDNISLRTTFNGLGLLNGSLTTQQQLTALAAAGGNPAVAASTVQAGFVPAAGTAVTNVDVSGANAADTYTFTNAAGVLTLTDGNTLKSQTINLTGQNLAAGSSTTLDFDSLGIKVAVANSTAAAVAWDTAVTGVAAGLNNKTITTALADHSATLQTGADASQGNTTSVSLLDTRLSGGSSAQMTALATAIGTFNTDAGTNAGPSDGDATGLITAIDTANAWISSQRAALGAAQNRLSYAAASLTTTAQNVTAANSQIRDVDVASETSNMSKDQILMQAGVSVLAQANQVQQLALKLLG